MKYDNKMETLKITIPGIPSTIYTPTSPEYTAKSPVQEQKETKPIGNVPEKSEKPGEEPDLLDLYLKTRKPYVIEQPIKKRKSMVVNLAKKETITTSTSTSTNETKTNTSYSVLTACNLAE